MELNHIKVNISEDKFRELCDECYNIYINRTPSI